MNPASIGRSTTSKAGTLMSALKETTTVKSQHEEDLKLVRRYLAGEPSTFDELMSRYERQIYHKCYQFVRNQEDAQDLTQEVFIKAFENLSSFRGESSLKTWLYRIAINHCINHVHKNTYEFVEVSACNHYIQPTAQVRLEEQEQRDELLRMVASLPPKQRAIVQMRMKDLSYEEIARETGRAVATVKATVFFALEKMRRLVKEPSVPTLGGSRA
jgi:RNA polymerase sigma-70 factor (ECF subfamily)